MTESNQKRFADYASKVTNFFTETIWEANVARLKPLRRLFFSVCRTIFLTIRGFVTDRCTLQASALTYITLVSIVPILAITLSFCKGVGLQEKIYDAIGVEAVKVTDAAGNPETIFSFIERSADAPATGKYTRLAAGLPETMQNAVIQLLTYVDKTNFAALGIIGLLTLLFTEQAHTTLKSFHQTVQRQLSTSG